MFPGPQSVNSQAMSLRLQFKAVAGNASSASKTRISAILRRWCLPFDDVLYFHRHVAHSFTPSFSPRLSLNLIMFLSCCASWLLSSSVRGIQRYTYWATTDPTDADAWVRLPHVIPSQIIAFRNGRSFFTGRRLSLPASLCSFLSFHFHATFVLRLVFASLPLHDKHASQPGKARSCTGQVRQNEANSGFTVASSS